MTREGVRSIVGRHRFRRLSGPHFVQSAVLVPLLCKDGEMHVLLTERTQDVRSHKGQVCFPGGTPQPEDGTLLATALREAWEETGIDPKDVDVVGEIDDNVVASTGYVISPFVGFVPYPYDFHAGEGETKDIFLVPLRVLMDPREFYDQERVIGEHYYHGPVCDFDGHVIWGATGRILKQFVALLSQEPAALP